MEQTPKDKFFKNFCVLRIFHVLVGLLLVFTGISPFVLPEATNVLAYIVGVLGLGAFGWHGYRAFLATNPDCM